MNRRKFLKAVGLTVAASTAGVTVGAEDDKTPDRPKGKGRPNVVLILADDMGFSDPGCYGGDIQTPNLDALAAKGLRYTQCYSTGRCWPTRACILSGYYAQQVRRDKARGLRMGPRPRWGRLLPEWIKPLGYHSYHSGKWHIDGSPKSAGFERSWGAQGNGCDWDRFFATKRWTEGNEKAPVKPGEPYYSTVAIADHAIACLKLHRKHHGDEPFFQYVAFYSPHFPLHAMQKDIDRYRGHYAAGWDEMRKRRWQRMKEMGIIGCPLSARDEDVIPGWNCSQRVLEKYISPGEAGHAVAWDTLNDEQKKFQSMKMAIHAAMVSRMDAEIGRIVRQLKDMGAYKNTLILFASDNGASAEQLIRGDMHDKSAEPGSAGSYLCLGPGWANVSNAPFRLYKYWNHEGGISSPLIAHWPEGIQAHGELRHGPAHFIDVAPTVLDLAGGSWPTKTAKGVDVPPTPGRSLAPTFARDVAVDRDVLWWCHEGNRALRMGDWKITMRTRKKSRWELYDLRTDRCEMNDLAAKHPERVKAMAERWQQMLDGYIEELKKDPTPLPPPRPHRKPKWLKLKAEDGS